MQIDVDRLKENLTQLEKFKDRLMSAKYSHWNGLLTFNGILISAFSVVAALNKPDKVFVITFFVSAICSSYLIIKNFVGFETMYDQLIKSLLGTDPHPTEANRENRTSLREDQSRERFNRVYTTYGLLFVQILILLLII